MNVICSMRGRCVARIQATRDINKMLKLKLSVLNFGIMKSEYILMKFTHYVGKVPIK